MTLTSPLAGLARQFSAPQSDLLNQQSVLAPHAGFRVTFAAPTQGDRR
jgi:hypothetical protein